MYDGFKWTFKVWMTCVWAAPVLASVIFMIFDDTAFNIAYVAKLIFTMGVVGLIISLPFAFLLWALCYLLLILIKHPTKIKIALSLLGALLSISPFLILQTASMPVITKITLPICYSITAFAVIWLYDIEPEKNQ